MYAKVKHIFGSASFWTKAQQDKLISSIYTEVIMIKILKTVSSELKYTKLWVKY